MEEQMMQNERWMNREIEGSNLKKRFEKKIGNNIIFLVPL